MKKKIIVGLSGGVDSAVSAHLLIQAGYEVEALFMKNWEGDDDDEYCPAAQDLNDAKAIANQLNIPIHVVNFARAYWDDVFTDFLNEYTKGATPNPDVLCNTHIKFKAFLDYACQLGASHIATGHYVGVSHDSNGYWLECANDQNKDQTYFLCQLNQDQLSKSLFPLARYKKEKIRQIAAELGYHNAKKKDSTGICFIGERKFTQFLKEYVKQAPGPMVTDKGLEIAQHQGLAFYTIGQRKGIDIGGLRGYDEQPWFVYGKNIQDNALLVCQGTNNPLLYSNKLLAEPVQWITNPPHDKSPLTAKVRYRQKAVTASLNPVTDGIEVLFEEPVRAIAPGQFVVFYQDNRCLGGSKIIRQLS